MGSLIECSCGDKDCKIKIRIDEYLWVTDKDGKETLIYLDANAIVKMIDALRILLIKKTNMDLTSITEK